MKRIFYATGFLLAAAVIAAVLLRKNGNDLPKPTDTIVIEEDGSHYLEREKWIEGMHYAAPGTDWKEIDRENIARLRESRADYQIMKSGSGIVEIAGGRLHGEWNEKGSHNLSGRMHCVDVDFANEHIYGASAGGQIWRGNMEGKNWESLSDYFQVKGISFLRVFQNNEGNPRIMMASSHNSPTNSGTFYYSDDDGHKWLTANGLRTYNPNNFIRAVSRPDGTIYVLMRRSGRSYLLRSTDLGTEFSLVDSRISTSKVDIWTPRFDMGPVYLIDQDKLFILNEQDELVSSGTVNINFSTAEIEQIQLNGCITDSSTYLYIMYRLEKATKFFGSPDGGQSWTPGADLSRGPFMNNSFGVSTINPLLLGFGEVDSYRSEDGGKSWQLINGWGEYYQNIVSKLHADIPEIEFIRKPGGGELCFVSTDGGTYISENGLAGVTNISLQGLHISQYYSTYTHRQNTDIIYAGSQDQGFQRSVENTGGPASFEQTISGDYGHIVSSDGGKSLWTVYPGFAMRYPAAAVDNYLVMWNFTGKNHFWMPPLMADPYFPERVYLAGGTSTTGNHLWYLDHRTSGITATELPYDFSAGTDARISAMAFSPINKDYRYVLNSYGKFFYSSDRGTSWDMSVNRGPDSHYFYGNSIVPDVNDINTIYIGGSGYSGSSVWVSRNGGESFHTMSNGLPNTLVFEMAINEDGTLLFAATEVGPFVWIASEEMWFDLSGGSAPEQTYWSVDYVTPLRTARFGTYGRGIWDFKITEYTGMEKIFAHRESMGLNIYPNPVSEIAQIEAVLPGPGDLEVRVISSDGKMLWGRQEDNLPSGPFNMEFDAASLPSGIYYVQVISGNRTTVGKMVRK